MNSQSYYRDAADSGCDVAVGDRFLVVNCAGICAMEQPFATNRQQGRKDYYLMYLYEGALDMDVGGSMRPVGAGRLIVHPPGCPLRYAMRQPGRMIYYWAHFTGSGARALLESCRIELQTVYRTAVSAAAADSFQALFRNFMLSDPYSQVAAAAQLASILVQLRRDGGDASPGRAANPVRRVGATLDYMHRHYGEPVSVADLAALEKLSVSRYCALFKSCMGVSPRTFLIDLRLQMAAELMLRTDLSLKQIAHSVGYDDQLYFSRLFKSRRGVSPRRYILQSCAGTQPAARESRISDMS